MNPLIAITTDFGSGSTYVAQMKGVLLGAVPAARLVDCTHDLPAHDITRAELYLRSVAFAFPLETTHLVVVDPGVGSRRRAIAVRTRGMNFVGPDNGVLGIALAQPDARVVTLDRSYLFREPCAPTFHGRDVFAPVAAELAAGLPLEQVGTPIDDPLPSTLPPCVWETKEVRGALLGEDRFGNITTNIPVSLLNARSQNNFRVHLQGERLPVHRTYAEASPGILFALAGSDGFLEVACRESSAVHRLKWPGTPMDIHCRWDDVAGD